MKQGQSATAIYTAYAELYGIKEDVTALPLPDTDHASNGITEMLELMFSLLVDSSLEPDTGDLLWQLVQVLHRQAQRCERESDSNADKQRELQDAQDGSEVKAVSLEEALTMGHFLQERQAFYEGLRDHAADVYEGLTGKAWLPRSGSKGSRSPISAAVVDSRAFLHAQQQAKQQAHLPAGVRVVVSGGKQATHQQVWAILDKVKAKHGEIVLLHGGGDGVEHLAALWAKNRQVAQVMFRPDWNKHGRAAPFKRNDALLRQAPQGVIVIAPNNGIHQQLIREATQQSLPLMVVEA